MSGGYTTEIIRDAGEKMRMHRLFGLSLPINKVNVPEEYYWVISVRKEGSPIGLGSGYFIPEKQEFKVFYTYIKKEALTSGALCFLIQELLCTACKNYQIFRCFWNYQMKEGNRDTYLALIKRIPDVLAKDHLTGMEFVIDLALFGEKGHNGENLTQEFLWEKGYRLVRWSDCDASILKQFREMEKSADEELRALLPFVEEDTYDPETSIVALDKNTDRVISWIINRKLDEETVELRRRYTMPEYRKSGCGIYFPGHVMKLLRERYKRLVFTAAEGNLRMADFARRYYRGAVIEVRYKKYMEIEMPHQKLGV